MRPHEQRLTDLLLTLRDPLPQTLAQRRAAVARFWDQQRVVHDLREYVRDEAGRFAETEGGGLPDVPVLKDVDLAANAARLKAQFATRHFSLTGQVLDPEQVRFAEQELRALPLVHGTTIAGALGALDGGLKSYADMQAEKASFEADVADLKDEIVNLVGDDVEPFGWDEVAEWTADDVEGLGLPDRRDAKALVEKVAELQDIQRVLAGTTNQADAQLGLDRFVFMTHGAKHPDYGDVGVIIDNAVLASSVVTEKDIVSVPGTGIIDAKRAYLPEGVKTYQSMLVRGEDYYGVAAAHAANPAMLMFRSRDQLFEVKAPTVPTSAVKGFVVYGDLDEAQRLSEKLADKGLTNKVLYVEDPRSNKYAPYVHEQLKTIQATGAWDADLAEAREAEAGAGGTFVLRWTR